MIFGHTKQLAVIFTLCLGATVGCGSDDDDNTNSNSSQVSDETNMPADVSDETSMPADVNDTGSSGADPSGLLDGTWVVCDFGELDTLTVIGNTATIRTDDFLDDDCTQPDTESSVDVSELSLEFPSGTTQTSLGTAYWTNATLESITFDGVAPTADQLELLQENNLFETQFDIYIVPSDGNLYFGEGVGDSADTRPTQIDLTRPWIRQ